MRKSRAKPNKPCQRCGQITEVGRGRKFCDECRNRTCSIEGCDRPVHAKDMCKSCHQKWWRAKDREENDVPTQFWYQIKSRYNLTREDFELMIEIQNNICPICLTTPERWCVDHDHSCCPAKGKTCGKCVRGLLCFRCNSSLELVEDQEKLERALKYLSGGTR